MEILHNDFLSEPDGDNQVFISYGGNFDEHKFDKAGEELLGVDVNSGLNEVSNETNPQEITQPFPSRKVHSAAPTLNGFGFGDTFDDVPRPYTAAGAEFPHSATQQRKKKSATMRKKTGKDRTPRDDRPRSAEVNEWGDFDTDRLLRNDFEDQSNQTPLDPLDEKRSRSRKSRRSTPVATHSPSPDTNPWEGYLTLNNETKEPLRPTMQVLRQKTIEILHLDLETQTNQPSGRVSVTPKPLLGRVSMERLIPSRSRPVTTHTSRSVTQTLLFGTDIPNTPVNRAAIFGRFADLWSLISHHSRVDQPSEVEPVEAVAGHSDAQTRSPFECSMTMVKICKTVGISLKPSAATRLSFWNTNGQDVEFEAFCDLVTQGAIQPAFHHFNLDNSIGEYASALDTILQSLVTTEPARRRKDKPTSPVYPRRLKELNEIQPVFMSWKAGITPRLIQPDEDSASTPTRPLVTAEKVRKALEMSVSQHMLAHQLPSEEARVTHVENIRRKVQLHKSWKVSAEGKFVERGVSSPMAQVSRGNLNSSHEQQIPTSKAVDLAEMLDRARTVFPTSAEANDVFFQEEGDRVEYPNVLAACEFNDATPEKESEAENEEVLVCCSCSVRSALLWCSSCFMVNCQKCWQEIHSCTVDMSMVLAESSSARKPLLGPTALAMKKKRSGSATLRPQVAMIYLPTKATASGTLARGNPIVRRAIIKRKSSNQVIPGAVKGEIPAVVANAILPSLHKSRSTGTILRHHKCLQVENTPTSDLVASLMVGSHTPMESVMRVHKHHVPPRPKMQLAPVSLDAELLLSTTPDPRR